MYSPASTYYNPDSTSPEEEDQYYFENGKRCIEEDDYDQYSYEDEEKSLRSCNSPEYDPEKCYEDISESAPASTIQSPSYSPPYSPVYSSVYLPVQHRTKNHTDATWCIIKSKKRLFDSLEPDASLKTIFEVAPPKKKKHFATNLDDQFEAAIFTDNLELLNELIQLGLDPSASRNWAIRQSSKSASSKIS